MNGEAKSEKRGNKQAFYSGSEKTQNGYFLLYFYPSPIYFGFYPHFLLFLLIVEVLRSFFFFCFFVET